MTDTKEALAALDYVELLLRKNADSQVSLGRADEALTIARAALQSVAQEREDWRAIEEWRAHGNQTAAVVIGLLTEAKSMPTSFIGVDDETFSKALSAAATWARAEMAK